MSQPKPQKHESLLLNLVCNIVLPTLLLTIFSKDKYLGPLWGLIVAVLFPVCYGIWDFATRRKMNFISIIGFVSVLASGVMGLIKANGFAFAVKDAVMPSIIGISVLLSLRSKQPLIRELLFNEQLVDVPRVDTALAERDARPAFDRLMVRASCALAVTFFVSAAINFATARWLIRSAPGTPEFNAELGKMHSIGMLVMAVPAVAMMMVVFWRMIKGIELLTGLTMDEIFRGGPPPAQKKSEPVETQLGSKVE
ncbi:MAG: VC0807 family protein [Nibricoccus sp.]